MGDAETSEAINRPPSSSFARVLSLPSNLLTSVLNFTNDDATKAHADSPHTSNRRSFILSSILPANPSTTAAAATPTPDDDSTMFAEPETHSNSDDASREGSVDESGLRKLKKSSRAKTCYSICHPPPRSTAQKLHRRPRSLMQLHRLSTTTDSRPRPAFEILNSTKATTRVFKGKHGQCPSDLVVLKAEKYSATEVDEEQEAGDIIAMICKGRKDDAQAVKKAKICFPDGREWEAYPTPTFGYEFFTTDEHGLGITVRWVPKRNRDGTKPSVDSQNRKFNFSTISPNSRRHPVIATLSKTSLDINDTFKIPDPYAVTPLSTPMQSSTVLNEALDDEGHGKNMCETDDRLREIITISAIWVAFKEGWSPFLKCDDKEKDAMSLPRSPSFQGSPSPSKAATFGATSISSPPGSPAPPSPASEKRPSIKSTGSGLSRKGGMFSKNNRASTSSLPEEDLKEPASPSSTSLEKTGRTRAGSASTVLVHRAASNRAKNQQQASWRVEMLASQQEMREQPSAEDLARSKSDGDVPLSTVTQPREEAVARPILPSAHNSATSGPTLNGGTGDDTARTSRRRSVTKQKRETTPTSNSTASTSDVSRKPPIPVKKKRGVLRRLLCGSGEDT